MVHVKKPVALQAEENAFIEKTLHYIGGIRGVVLAGLVLSTNTRYPTRYILAIRGVPPMTLEDFQNIRDMNNNIKSVSISIAEEVVRIEVWRVGKRPQSKRKRKRPKKTVVTPCDLTSVDERDRKCLRVFLLRINAMPEIECQFEVHIDTSMPEHYLLELHVLDTMSLDSLEAVVHECRSFCTALTFDFSRKVLRATCLRMAAPLRRKVRLLKSVR